MNETAPSVQPPHAHTLYALQILRGLAAFAVMLVHVPVFLEGKLGLTGLMPPTLAGSAGVDVFFVISGFIMVYASQPLFGRPGAPFVFFARRLARIVPLYWAASGLVLGYMLAIGANLAAADLSWGAIWSSFLFVPYPRPSGAMLPLINVGWTLNYEMFFYLVFALALVLSRARAILAVTAFFAALTAAGYVTKPALPWLAFLTNPIILEFCFGMLIAQAFLARVSLPRPAALALILLSCAAFAASARWGGFDEWRVPQWGVPAAMLVVGALWFAREASADLVRRALVRLGDASYSLYLLHVPVLLATPHLILRLVEPAAHPWFCLIAMLAAPVVVALLTYALFERPVTRVLQRRITRRAHTSPEPVAAGI